MQGEDDTRYGWMATKVLLGNGKNPGRNAVRTFFRRVDKAGHAWYPGHYTGKPGRKLALTSHKRRAIATSMMAAKKRGAEPSYDLALALAPVATFNETTQAPFTRKVINAVLTTDCYDHDPKRPWEFRYGAKRKALTIDEKEYRMDWAKRLLEEDHSAAWYREKLGEKGRERNRRNREAGKQRNRETEKQREREWEDGERENERKRERGKEGTREHSRRERARG